MTKLQDDVIAIEPWYLANLVCPRDHNELHLAPGGLTCAAGHRYPVVDGVPVMLLEDVRQTLEVATTSLGAAAGSSAELEKGQHLYLETVGVSDAERRGIAQLAVNPPTKIDPVVSYLVGATNGIAYQHLIGHLQNYPIPEIRLPIGAGKTLLDLGCNWGRWCLAAAQKGYQPVGLDPSLGAVLAARRVARQLGLNSKYVVGDARFLPFRRAAFETVFSYSVVQHMSPHDAEQVISEIGRVLAPGGTSLVQMPTAWGIRCLYHQARRRFRRPQGFEVRYWRVAQLRRLFSQYVGPAMVSVDCFFGIGLQRSDWSLMPMTHKAALFFSEALRAAAKVIYPLVYVADSVYVTCRRKD
jgi:SAM-dependent methyltransferase/uncharacterized protein YbaR (Trm112 family)